MRYPLFSAILMIIALNYSCGSIGNSSLALFESDGKNWFSGGDAVWSFNNSVLVGTASGGSGFVMSSESYSDFELVLEFFPDSTVNSGVFVRCNNKELSNTDCYEMNIWDLHPDQMSRTGSVVTRAVPQAHVATIDKWNTYKIRCQGNHIETWVNNELTVDIYNTDLVEGYIALQAAETGTVKFRNVQIKKLNPD